MTNIIAKTVVELFLILGVVTKEVEQGRTSMSLCFPSDRSPKLDIPAENFIKRLEGRKEIEESLQRLDQLTHEARLAAAETLAPTRSIDDKVKAQAIDIDNDKKAESHNKRAPDNLNHEPFEATPSPLNPYDPSRSLMPHSRASFPTPPPTAALGLPRSSGAVVTAAEVTEPTISITNAAPATGAQSPSPAFIPSRSRSPAFPERVGDQKWGGNSVIATGNSSKHKRTNPIEQAEGYARTRSVCPFIFLPVLLMLMLCSV